MKRKYRLAGILLAGAMAVTGMAPLPPQLGITASAASKLAAPTGLKATAKRETSLTIAWDAVTGAEAYRLYRYSDETKTFEEYATLTKTSYTLKQLYSGTEYRFRVVALVKSGKEWVAGKASKILKVKTTGEVKLLPPGNLRAGAYKKSVLLTWDKTDGADAYCVYKYDSKTGKFSEYKRVTGTSCTVKALTPGTKYYFKAAAMVKTESGYVRQNVTPSVSAVTIPADRGRDSYAVQFPPFGISGSLAVKQLGMKDAAYQKDKQTGGGVYTGTLKLWGKTCTVMIAVNENDRLYSCIAAIPVLGLTAKKARKLITEVYGSPKAQILFETSTIMAWVDGDRSDMLISDPKAKNIVYFASDLGLAPDAGISDKVDMSGVVKLLERK